jgi:Na+/H+ antiporter NhaD/arsenite permease-like protein
MLLPGAVTCATALATLHFTFREDLRGALSLPNLDPESELQSRRGAVVHAATLGICLLFMCVSSAVPGVELWMVALGAACVSLAYNLAALPWRVPAPTAALPGPGSGPSPAALRGPSPRSNSSSAAEGADSSADLSDLGALGFDASAHTGAVLSARGLPASDADAGDQAGAVGGADAEVGADASAESGAHASQGKPQAHWPVVAALPWTLMPFVFGMFCLVQALLVHGWVDEFARWCVGAMGGAAVLRERDSGAAPLLASLFMMFATLLLCNTANNQPATILLTRVLLAPPMRALGPNAHRAAVLAVIAGSNISACLTPIGALAGILFCAVLETHKVKVTYGAFVRVGLAALPVALACALAVALIVAAT